MLRPSAFQNNGNTEASSSKSILRPSSFQLAPSSLSSPDNTKKQDTDEPSTTSSDPFKLDEESVKTTDGDQISETDDAKITSTTTNDGESSGESNEDAKASTTTTVTNSFVNASADEDNNSDTETAAKQPNDDDGKTKNESASNTNTPTTPTVLGAGNLFSSNTKNLFAAATSKTGSLLNSTSSSKNNFVFGQNIHERIVGVPDTSTTATTNDDSKSDSCCSTELFAAAAANSTSQTATTSTSSSSNGTAKDLTKESSRVEDLTKVAREYEESRVQKRKLDAVETFTGEEDEVNVLDVSCKLFAFISSNWEQRGPGSLRLNDIKSSGDDTEKHSRLVFRTLGNFRVLLNTQVWNGMVVEKPSQKSLRFTAIGEDGQIKIYLVMARPDDVSSFYAALKKRIDSCEPATKKERTSL